MCFYKVTVHKRKLSQSWAKNVKVEQKMTNLSKKCQIWAKKMTTVTTIWMPDESGIWMASVSGFQVADFQMASKTSGFWLAVQILDTFSYKTVLKLDHFFHLITELVKVRFWDVSGCLANWSPVFGSWPILFIVFLSKCALC